MKNNFFVKKLIPLVILAIYSQSGAAAVSCSNVAFVNANCSGTDFTSNVSKSRLGSISSSVGHTLPNGPFDFTLNAGTGISATITNSGSLDLINYTTAIGSLLSTIGNNGDDASINGITNTNLAGVLTSTISNDNDAQINGSINLTTGAGVLNSTISNDNGAQINGSINLTTGAGVLNSTINNGSVDNSASKMGDINLNTLAGALNTGLTNYGNITGTVNATAVAGVLNFDFDNRGQFTGRVNTFGSLNPLTGISSQIINHAGATWEVTGNSDILSGDDTLTNKGTLIAANGVNSVINFGLGENTVENAGVIDASNGNLTFTHTQSSGSLTFRNYIINNDAVTPGTISMTDGDVNNNRVTINGDYDSGWDSGILTVDADLKLDGASDKLYINGSATGLTHVTVTDLNVGFASAYNPNGMLVVDVDGQLNTEDGNTSYRAQQLFTLSSGPIDKGFFDYDLYYSPGDTDDNNHRWYLRNAPNVRAYELPKIATAAQEVWYESSNAWKDRAVGMRSLLTSAESDQSMPSGPSVWIRAFGAKNDRNTSNQILTASGTVIADTGYDQRTSGFVAGIDSKVMEGEDSGSLLFGYMAGYTHSTLDFDNSGSNADIQGVNLGAYASYAKKGFFLDALIKFDHHDIDYKTNFFATDNSQSFDGRSFGALLNAGYRIGSFPGTQGLFFEPSFSLARVVSNFDNFRMLNSDVEISKAGSTRSRLGTRYGNTWASEGLVNEAYVDIGANWESDRNNSAILSNGTNSVSVSDKRDGNFGDIALGLNLIDTGSGLSGFAKVQHRFHNEQKVSGVQLGIRYKF